MEVKTNMKVIRRSRHRPKPGDIFAMLWADDRYLFGRVIRANLPSGLAPIPTANLIYIYRWRADSKVPDVCRLTVDQLLLPPIFTNRMGWTNGYFETIDNRPLSKDDVLPRHCFWDSLRNAYIDENQRPLPEQMEPRGCGSWGLVSYRWIDDQISDALGYPRIPADDP